MTWEQLLPSIALVIALAGAVALARWYLPSYLAEKAKSLATKEDVAQITREVEQVRHEYARHLEELAHQHRLVLEQGSRRHQLRLAALDRRLDVHQQAYTLWLKLVASVHNEAEIGDVVIECQEWWGLHCLYLDESVRQAFREAYLAAANHRDFTRARVEARIIKDNWDTITSVGERIVKAVELPPIAGVDSGIGGVGE